MTGWWPQPSRRPTLALALSGWIALAATTVSAVPALRAVVTSVFLLLCPGLALVLSAQALLARRGHRLDRLEAVVFTVALSLSVDALVAVGFHLTGSFTPVRATAVLAALTTAGALFALRSAGPGRPDPPGPGRTPRWTPRWGRWWSVHRLAARSGAAGLLVLAAACGGGGGATEVWHTPGATVTTSDPSSLVSPAAAGAWQLVFQDEFDATGLNPALWATCYDWNNAGCTNAGNHELEWYLPAQVSVSSGALNLSAVRRPVTGSDGKVYPWTSGMVTTGRDNWDAAPRRTFTRGYFAAAIQIPAQAGMFPAFWLMPQTRQTPPELDVAEFIGGTDNVQMTVHWPENGKDMAAARTYGPVDFPAGYHVFALDWEQDSLTWYVDGVARFHDTDPAHIPSGPMELLLNLAVGYPKAPPDGVSVANMRVDWVRVWQH